MAGLAPLLLRPPPRGSPSSSSGAKADDVRPRADANCSAGAGEPIVTAAEPRGQAVAVEDTLRSITLVYGTKAASFGWRASAAPAEFAEQLRSAVRHLTSLSSLAGAQLQVEEPLEQEPEAPPSRRSVVPRDLYEQRLPKGARVYIVSQGDQSKAEAGDAAPRRGAETTCSREPQTLQPPQRNAGPQRARRKYQKGGGSQLKFMQLMNENKNPKANLPDGTKLTPEEIARHDQVGDCWTVFDGKVYDITLYLDFHPGGKQQLKLGAGKDCTALFKQVHQWVSIDGILGKLCLGKVEFDANGPPLVQATSEEGDLE